MSFVKLRDEKEGEKTNSGAVSGGQNAAPQGRGDAYLGQGSKVVGTLTFTGPVELDGQVEGEVNAKEALTIGKSAVINAKISGSEIVVFGTVNGDINATKRLSLRKPARVTGNLTCGNLSIEEGVVFEGKCTMSSTPSSGGESKPPSKSGAA